MSRLLKPVVPDACAYAVVLVVFAIAFYLNWNFWDDQAAQAYMAWGLFHGMRPYVDLVDPNWPGILLPHALAYLVAGTDAWGLRALDLVFIYAMLMATSLVLAAWRTPLALRLLAGCCYLTTYFATGWLWTAQRESFCWPLFVVGSIPILLMLGPHVSYPARPQERLSRSTWFGFGSICGLSLWIKPTSLLAVIFLILACVLLCDRDARRIVLRELFWYLLGLIAVSLAFLIALGLMGALGGFIKWGIRYDLGPYSRVKFPWSVRLHVMSKFFTDLRLRPLALAVLIPGIVTAAFFRHNWIRWSRPIMVLAGLVMTGGLSVLLQGKPGSLYHFIPLVWALASLAAVVWSVVPWTNRLRDVAFALAAMIVVLTAYKEPRNAGTTAGTLAGRQLNAHLGADDQLVEWGYSPTLLLAAQRRTPFMTFIGTAFLVTSPPDSWAAREVLGRLDRALRDPNVRYLLVERLANYRIQPSTPKWPMNYLDSDPAISQTLQTQYRKLPDSTVAGFAAFVHLRVSNVEGSSIGS